MKCDVCGKKFEASEATTIGDDEALHGGDMTVCPTCLVEGVVEGYVSPNLDPRDDDDDGEEWKS